MGIERTEKSKSTRRSHLHARSRDWRFVKFIERKDEDHLIFAGFVVIVTALVFVTSLRILDRKIVTKASSSQSSEVRSDQLLSSTQLGTNGVFSVQITSVTARVDPDPAFPLEEDETLLIVDIFITNESLTKQDLVPVNQLFVRSRDGGYYQMHPSTNITAPLAATSLEPGQTVSGQISYAIPKRLSRPLLYVDLGWNDALPIIFDVYH